jgi:uroporphyrinogen decarboxylase
LGQNAAKYFGESNRTFNTSPKVTVKVLEGVFRRFRPDSISVNAGLQSIPEAIGTKLTFPEFAPPRIDEPGLKDYNQLSVLAPIDPNRDGRLPNFFEALEELRSKIGSEVPLDFSLGGPFTSAVLLVGLEKLMRDTVLDQENVHRVLELTTSSIIKVLEKVAKTESGASLAEPMASTMVVSPKVFRTFVKPYLEKIVTHMREKCQRNLGIHICGKTRKIWTDVVETGITAFSLDNLENLADAKQEIGQNVTLIGNIPPIEVLREGTRQEVLLSAEMCLKAAADNPKGFMLASGCEVVIDTPEENILAMMDAVRIYGQKESTIP